MMSKQSVRGSRRKPYTPPRLTYFGQMNEIVMASPKLGSSNNRGTGSGGSVFRGWKDSY